LRYTSRTPDFKWLPSCLVSSTTTPLKPSDFISFFVSSDCHCSWFPVITLPSPLEAPSPCFCYLRFQISPPHWRLCSP
jgi:hypothetical protein